MDVRGFEVWRAVPEDVERSAHLFMPSGVYYIGPGLRGIALGPGWEMKTYMFQVSNLGLCSLRFVLSAHGANVSENPYQACE